MNLATPRARWAGPKVTTSSGEGTGLDEHENADGEVDDREDDRTDALHARTECAMAPEERRHGDEDEVGQDPHGDRDRPGRERPCGQDREVDGNVVTTDGKG